MTAAARRIGPWEASSGVRRPAVELLSVSDCPNVDAVRRDVRRAMTSLGLDPQWKERVGAFPSPTVLVDGHDVVTHRPPSSGSTCRLDLPGFEQLVEALAAGSRVSADGASLTTCRPARDSASRPVR
ncbi:MAG: hypothetical protein WAK18_16225 [Nocardioidaceae bacterium]